MGKFKIFNKGKTKNATTVSCSNLTTTQSCSLVDNIREWQQEVKCLENEIEKIDSFSTEITQIHLFLCSPHLHNLFRSYEFKSYLGTYQEYYMSHFEIENIYRALSELHDPDKFIYEITSLIKRGEIRAEKKERIQELQSKITEAKDALGIK